MIANKIITTENTENHLNILTKKIIGAAIEVHKALGPGLLESTYEACLRHELKKNHLRVEHQKPLPISYKGMILDCGYRLDLVVENQVIEERFLLKGVALRHKRKVIRGCCVI